MNTKNKAFLISGTIILMLTIIISLLSINNWTGISVVAFTTILWAEVVFFGGMILLDKILKNHEKIMFIVPYILIISSYSVLAILTSIVFIALLKTALSLFFIIQLILIATAGIALTIFISASKVVGSSNEKILTSVNQVNGLVKRLELLAVSEIGDKYAASFKKLSHDLNFTDISAITEEDELISEQLSIIELEVANYIEETSDQKIQNSIVHLNSLIAKRSISAANLKKGKI
ncbi:hypothetical protein [Fusibacter bizertensis]